MAKLLLESIVPALAEALRQTAVAGKREVWGCASIDQTTGKVKQFRVVKTGGLHDVDPSVCPLRGTTVSFHSHPTQDATFSKQDRDVVLDRVNSGKDAGHCVVSLPKRRALCVVAGSIKIPAR